MGRLAGVLTALLAGLVASAAVAATAPQQAQALVQSTAETVLERLRSDHETLMAEPGRIYPLVQDLVLPHFDFRAMARWVLGKHWRAASAEQRRQFTEQFRNLLVRTYAKALLEYDDQQLRYLPLQAAEDARRVTVKTEIVQSGGPAIPISYAMYRRRDGKWKVYDIAVDGASMVSTYRSSYYTQIRRSGIDGLIDSLRRLNAQSGRADSGE